MTVAQKTSPAKGLEDEQEPKRGYGPDDPCQQEHRVGTRDELMRETARSWKRPPGAVSERWVTNALGESFLVCRSASSKLLGRSPAIRPRAARRATGPLGQVVTLLERGAYRLDVAGDPQTSVLLDVAYGAPEHEAETLEDALEALTDGLYVASEVVREHGPDGPEVRFEGPLSQVLELLARYDPDN